jgi:hypothetical protein
MEIVYAPRADILLVILEINVCIMRREVEVRWRMVLAIIAICSNGSKLGSSGLLLMYRE